MIKRLCSKHDVGCCCPLTTNSLRAGTTYRRNVSNLMIEIVGNNFHYHLVVMCYELHSDMMCSFIQIKKTFD